MNLLFNNAGVAGGYSFVAGDRAEWDRTFAICWGGVYHCSRAFMPLLIASDAGYIVNSSSVNGFWAALGPQVPHTAYSTAKFAVKGFSESLLTDLRQNAPHVRVAVVMPGHVGTGIVANTTRVLDGDAAAEALREVSDGFSAQAPVSARRRRRSSSMACGPASGASSSATTRGHSTKRCEPTRWRSTAPTVSRSAPSPAEVTRGGRRIEQPRRAQLPVAVDQSALGEQFRVRRVGCACGAEPEDAFAPQYRVRDRVPFQQLADVVVAQGESPHARL